MRITATRLRTVIRSILLREELDAEQSNNSPGVKRKIYVLVGPPSVGKSTWISRTFKDSQPYIISRDDIAEAVAERQGWTYDDMFHAPPKDAQLGDTHPQFGEVVPSPKYMTWQPLSYAGISAANREIGGEFGARVAAAGDSGRDIVVDMTSMNAAARKGALAAIKGREGEFEKIAVVFLFQGAEDAVQRVAQIRADRARAQGKSKTVPPAAIARMMSAYEPVTPGEGFDSVIEFDNRSKLRAVALTANAEEDTEQAGAGADNMRHNEAGLRQIIRRMLLEGDADQAETSPAADQAHKQLERQPVDDTNLMVKGDAAYTAFIRQHPKAQAGLDSIFAIFETARQNRLRYLRTSFAERYKALQRKLNTGTAVDVEQLKQSMISRVEKTQLKMGTYGEAIKSGYKDSTYITLKDPTSGWSKDLARVGFTDKSNPDKYHVIAYAPAAEALVVTEPPHLKLGVGGEVEAAIPSEDILSTLEHELIHQEDHAANALLGLPQHGSVQSGAGGAAEFATRLIRQAMIPKDRMTIDLIYNRLAANSMTVNILEVADSTGFIVEGGTLFPTAALAIAAYSDLLNDYPEPYSIFYYALERAVGKSLQTLVPGSEESIKINKLLSQSSGKPGYTLGVLMRDYQLDTHLRITLSLLLPHLQQALAESTDPATVIEAALTAMSAASAGDDVPRAAFILAITDPVKLRDLTLVALGDTKKRGADGQPEGPTALAEGTACRWARIAGLD